MKKLLLFFSLYATASSAQELSPLNVSKIMRDPKWMGTSPESFRWSDDSKSVYFSWNPNAEEKAQTYKVAVNGTKPQLADKVEVDKLSATALTFNKDKTLALSEKGGDIFITYVKSNKEVRLTSTVDRESNARFLYNNDIVYQKGDNLFRLNVATGQLVQLSNFVKGAPEVVRNLTANALPSAQDQWLRQDQKDLFDVIKNNNNAGARRPMAGGRFGNFGSSAGATKTLKPVYLGNDMLTGLNVSPDGRFVSYRRIKLDEKNKNTFVPNYVTASGYTENINGRTKVGEGSATYSVFILDILKDSVISLKTNQIPGIKDHPDYLKDYPKQLAERNKKNEDRQVALNNVNWSETGAYAVVTGRALDNKDFWILKLDPTTGNLSVIDRQRDEAWIAGPGIGRDVKWIDDSKFYFQSEATGYAHLYTYNIKTAEKRQLTNGNFEIQQVQLSADKKAFYIKANKEHPGITHFYKLPLSGGNLVQLTNMKGSNEVTLSPDEKWLAINYSYMNKPWELYLQENKPGAKAKKITKSTTAEFDSYNWQQPDLVSFKNRHNDDVYARVYPAKTPHPSKPAVVFVHGAGYLQNVHYGWSQYFREYMFNNMLADNGYTVIDIDYTASSGYGRNHRTGIYRHMGGKDLTDHVDGVNMLVEKYGVNPQNIGIYGGSYGGFITLMALFNEPEVFKSGAALRSVTDWAHYNHGYTSNILNEPTTDPNAYKKSSPIYFADKLKGNLLMLHGMVDVNVHFQDIVRLSQKLIELNKDNWELAVYPVEDHAFTTPSSWTDEYKRIFKLFEQTLKK